MAKHPDIAVVSTGKSCATSARCRQQRWRKGEVRMGWDGEEIGKERVFNVISKITFEQSFINNYYCELDNRIKM